MNLNRIANLPAPTLPHEAVNKLYVNGMPRNIFNDYVPNLRSFCPAKNDEFGFIITTSSYYSDRFHPVHAFNGLYRSGVEGDNNNLPYTNRRCSTEIGDIVFTPCGVERKLRKLKATSCAGPDGLQALLLKNLAHELAWPFVCIVCHFI